MFFFSVLFLGVSNNIVALAQDAPQWTPAGPADMRGPCPMLNTLANHNFLPHSGKDITEQVMVNALTSVLNFAPKLSKALFKFGKRTNPNRNITVISLDRLGIHNILEHDASLSRPDDFFNPSDSFNQTIFDETTSYWTGDTITLSTAAMSRHARSVSSVKTNPLFTFSSLALGFAWGEMAALLIVFGDRIAGTAPKSLVTSFFEEEKLPSHLGWTKPVETIEILDLCMMMHRVIIASGTTLEQAEKATFTC